MSRAHGATLIFDSTDMTRAGSVGFQALSYRQLGQAVVLGGTDRLLDSVSFQVSNHNDAAVAGVNFYAKVYTVTSGPASLSSPVSVWSPYVPNSAAGFDANYPLGWINYSSLQSYEANGTIGNDTWLYNSTAPGNWTTWGDLKAAVAVGGNQAGLTGTVLTEIATANSGPVTLAGGKTVDDAYTPTLLNFDFLQQGIVLSNTVAVSIGLSGVPNPGAGVSLNSYISGLSSVNVGLVYPGGTGQTPSAGSFTGSMLWDKFGITENATIYTPTKNPDGSIIAFTGAASNLPTPSTGIFGEQTGESYSPFYRPIMKVAAVQDFTNNTIYSYTAVDTNALVVSKGVDVQVDVSRDNLDTDEVVVTGSGSRLIATNGSPFNGVGQVSVVNNGSLVLEGSNSIGRLNIDTGGSVNQTAGAVLQLNESSEISGTGSAAGGTIRVEGASSNSPTVLTVNSTNNTSTVQVEANGVLKGSGHIGGIVLNTGGTISPGNSPGTQTVDGDVVFSPGGNYNWEIYNAAGTKGSTNGWDWLNVSGSLDLTALSAANKFNLNLWSLSAVGPDVSGNAINFDPFQNYTWTILTASGGISGFTGDELFAIHLTAYNGTAGFANSLSNNNGPGSFTLAVVGNDLNLIFTAAVPEPGTWAASILLAGGAVFARWRKRAKVS
ncbi:MAG: PEP-CTERM sorting domain-containing protein [Chthoniobacterales bacterium]